MLSLSATSPGSLLEQLEAVDIHVPPRHEGRKKEHCERWSICRLLSTVAQTDLLSFPLAVVHADRPDCVLRTPQGAIGVEITEAIPPNWAWASARETLVNSEGVMFLERFLPGEEKRSIAEIDKIAAGRKHSGGWVGNAPEREWADAMHYSIQAKLERLRQPGFALYPENWLLIYDNWPLPCVDNKEALALLENKLVEFPFQTSFGRIFIETSGSLLHIWPDGNAMMPINNVWRR